MDDTVLPPSEEIQFLDAALVTTAKIEDDLLDCMKILERLKIDNSKEIQTGYLNGISPGCSWKGAEYLSYNIDSVINEERQKHDSEQPQQHHKVQEINDDSTWSSSTEASTEVINHFGGVNSESNIDNGAAGDSENLSPRDGVGLMELDFLNRHTKIDFRKIKAKMALESTLMGLKRAKVISSTRAMQMNGYLIPRSRPGFVTRCRLFRRRSF